MLQIIKKRKLKIAVAALLLMGIGGITTSGSATAAPARVDLRAEQTPLKSQGSRRSCISFSSTAALEAAYKRAGYRQSRKVPECIPA